VASVISVNYSIWQMALLLIRLVLDSVWSFYQRVTSMTMTLIEQ